MSKLIDLNLRKKKIQKKKIIMNITFSVVAIYIVYAVYLIVKTPTDTVTIERRNCNSGRECNRLYN